MLPTNRAPRELSYAESWSLHRFNEAESLFAAGPLDYRHFLLRNSLFPGQRDQRHLILRPPVCRGNPENRCEEIVLALSEITRCGVLAGS